MDNRSNESKEAFVSEVRQFVDTEIRPFAARYDKDEALPYSVVEKLGERGYLGCTISKRYGGTEMDMLSIGLLNEELGKACMATKTILTVQGMVATAIEKWGSELQKETWLPKLASGKVIGAFGLSEPNIGSDAAGIETTAYLEDDVYVLNGIKKWITMGEIADVYIIFANCDGSVTSFLVEKNTPGLSVRPIKGLMGMRASMMGEIKIDNCRIPVENIIGSVGTGLSHVGLSCLDYGRYTVAWGCVGLAQACLDSCMKYCIERKQFGKSIQKYQLIQKMITEMIVDIKTARLLCINAGKLREEGDPDSISEIWCAKYKASKVVKSVAEKAVQIFGAAGYCNEHPVERYYRDAAMAEIIEGTSQIHELIISSNAFREYI